MMGLAAAVAEGQRVKSPLELANEQLAAAQEAVDVAEAEAQRLSHEDYVRRITEAYDKMMALPDEAFYAKDPGHDERPYVLPFGKDYAKWNPAGNDEEHGFGESWTANSTAIICRRVDVPRDGATRLIWTSGMVMPRDGERIGNGDLIGERFLARHDQTYAKLGEYVIVGLAFYGPQGGSYPARTVGVVPDRKFGQSTYK